MSKRMHVVGFALVLGLCFSSVTFAAGAKNYQVTGPILELTDAKIVVQKGIEKWEIDRTVDTKVTGELKVGEKVTIEYTMIATTIEVKGAAKAEKKAEKKP